MSEAIQIPMFPLTLLPLPGELVPLHIFEPRYKQLLTDVENLDVAFGIYCNHEVNTMRLGALMKLESIIKRYPGGESDIILRCVDFFTLEKMYRTYRAKSYPGGEVTMQNASIQEMPGVELYELFLIFQGKRNINRHFTSFSIYQIANELNLDLFDRYKFLSLSHDRRAAFLTTQLKFQIHVLRQEEKSKDVFHLN